MVEEPDRIRDDIESTRAALARDVDRLADKASPTRVAQRRWTSVKEKVRGVSDKVMGTPAGGAHAAPGPTARAGDRASALASQAGDKAGEAVDQVKETAEGAAQTTADEAKMSARDAADQVRA
jgi:hypothetical protein